MRDGLLLDSFNDLWPRKLTLIVDYFVVLLKMQSKTLFPALKILLNLQDIKEKLMRMHASS